ncbi:conserved hypothetical protein [Talaromyces stipitatus ATCC 10500]|uniref:Ubiquinol-cytochrome-c reductase cytochrome c1 n=1 Tax=Talaromyces stipitatus (strain ATCC 10500 / CBS 375.48 / QM 6759 / NRRL 1006) TaxID=441959 RepID=B8MME0_TALSN|nr:uncharacterized protein TSTA_099460 [Talaromyces stipitatus ATCC 10500]EED13694.1 conserved hypothetical protein [Talaromyces stipitatus ATCC 10500]
MKTIGRGSWEGWVKKHYGIESLPYLLEKEIFQSDVKAKIEFPELCHSSPSRDAQRAASENNAARSVAEVLEEVASREDVIESDGEGPTNIAHFNHDIANASTPAEQPSDIISLYPMYFPCHAQYVILSRVQSVLEECCFEFTRKWMPPTLEDGGWDCAAAIELTKWTTRLVKNSEKLPQHAFKLGEAPLSEVLFATHKLRHTAVHRLPATCRGVETLVKSAVSFAETLQDLLRTAQLQDLQLETDSKIKAMELNKNFLEDALSQELQKIQQQREELDMQERELAARIICEDRDNKSLIGNLLENSVNRLFDVKPVKESVHDVDQISDVEEKHKL